MVTGCISYTKQINQQGTADCPKSDLPDAMYAHAHAMQSKGRSGAPAHHGRTDVHSAGRDGWTLRSGMGGIPSHSACQRSSQHCRGIGLRSNNFLDR